MESFILSRVQVFILRACYVYQYVTNSQFHLLKIGHAVTIRKATRYLSRFPAKSPLLHCHSFAVSPQFGRREHVYTITSAGIEVLRELFPEESFAQMPPTCVYEQDYCHRKAVISFRMQLMMAMRKQGVQVGIYEQYFEKTGANNSSHGKARLHAKTRVEGAGGNFFVPDVVFVLRRPASKKRMLCTLECINGQDKKRTIRQIRRHMNAISERSVTRKYRIPSGQDYVSLFLFLNAGLMPKVLDALKRDHDFMPYREHFLFASQQDITRDVVRCWRLADDDQHLYNFITGQKSGPSFL